MGKYAEINKRIKDLKRKRAKIEKEIQTRQEKRESIRLEIKELEGILLEMEWADNHNDSSWHPYTRQEG